MCETSFIKKPCQHCPYRCDVRPFLTAARGEELAFLPQNQYSSFPCHKTLESDSEGDGELIETNESKMCAGFLTLRAAELGEDRVYECDHGFEPSYDLVYAGSYEMSDAYSCESNED